jgi:LPS O-antigen subunit length determinant protein (WzzB/FepE family)
MSREDDYYDEDIINLSEIIESLLKKKWIIVSTTLIFSIFSVFYSLQLPNIYKSEAVLAPVDSSSGLNNIADSYGGLASLAGFNVSNPVSKTQEGIKILESYRFFHELLGIVNIKPDLLAVSEWNKEENFIEYDPEKYNAKEYTWLTKSSSGEIKEPSFQEAYGKFDSIFDIKNSEGFIYLSIEHESPYFARDLLVSIIETINKLVKNEEKQKALNSIDFLNKQIIQNQTQTVMLAEASKEYLFKVIDPPIAPEQRYKPQRKIICIFGAILGLIFGIFIALIVSTYKNDA